MNNLINKAIQAIKDGKNEYAIGLLEGIQEMNGTPRLDPIIASTRLMPVFPEDQIKKDISDEGASLDALARAKVAGIMESANIEIA